MTESDLCQHKQRNFLNIKQTMCLGLLAQTGASTTRMSEQQATVT